jgi:uncharacterized protein YndB with AHSA1/START domain
MKQQFITTYQTLVKAPASKTWNALINPEVVKEYFFGSQLSTDWKVGRPIYFSGIWEGKPYRDKGIVLEYTPEKSLRFSYLSDWSGLADLPENYLMITYTLLPHLDGTIVTITQTNYNAEKAAHSKANWANVMDGMKRLIE